MAEGAAQGKTLVYLLVDDRLEGAIALADIIRPESREALARLKAMGIQVMMLTGDATAVARWVARELALDEFFRCHAQRPIGISGRWRCNRTSWRYVVEVAGEGD